MSEKLVNDEFSNQKEDFPEIQTNSSKKRLILILIPILLIIIIVVVVLVIVRRKKKDKENSNNPDSAEYPDIDFEITTVNFPSNITYVGSHYNYQGNLFLVYKKANSSSYFLGIANDQGELLNEVYEVKEEDNLDKEYIHRASSFSDGKRVLVGGKILGCEEELVTCKNAKIYDLIFPPEITTRKNLLYNYTEPIVNYGGEYIFWSTFDENMDIMSFVGKLEFKEGKYVITNTKGLSNYFYDLYDNTTGNFSLPKIIRIGPIKQVVNGGEALSIGGFLDYGLRKGIYQSLSTEELSRLTWFEGYEETTTISPDLKLACVMTTRFSESTSLEMVGLIPTPYSIIASYKFSYHLMKFSIGKIRMDVNKKGNLGPALVYLEKSKKDKDYKGKNLNTDENWIFYGFISWSPDGTKVMFDEISKPDSEKIKKEDAK